MARSANIPDSSVNSVAPVTGSGNDYINVQANPAAFGSQIGQAEQGAGKQIEDTGQKLQGMIFETAANNAETDYIKQSGAITGKFKSLEGIAAQAAIPQYQAEMTALRQNIRSTLPGGAARMFDQTTNKHESYAISDAYAYGAQQVKKATLDSQNAVAANAISSAGDITVASDDERFGSKIGDIKHSVASMMDIQGYGEYTKSDPETGKISFDESTPQGQSAKAVYQSELDKRVGDAWQARLSVLSDQNVISAYQKYQDNRDQIPGEAQRKLDAYFTPRVKDYQARTTADSVLSEATQQYSNDTFGAKPVANANAVNDIASAIHQQESSGKPHDYQIQPGTFAQYAKPGESFDNPKDHDAVYSRIITDLKQSYPNDPARQAVAYFSGKGNVSMPGSSTPWVVDRQDGNGKSVSSYVSDINNRLGNAPTKDASLSAQPVPSQADYYRSNYTQILDKAVAQAQQDHPDDPDYTDKVRAKTEQRMNDTIKQQELAYKADNDLVYRAFSGDLNNGTKPTSIEQMVASSPDVKAAWGRMLTNNPQAATAIETRILTTNAKGADKDSREYGAGFYNLFKQVHADPSNPDRITSPTQLYNHVGEGGDLTVAGLDRLSKELSGKNTPDGEAESQMKKQFFANAKAQISGADEGLHIKDPKGDELYLKFMAQAFPAYEKGKSEGKLPMQLLNPESPDYIGKSIQTFKRPMSQWVSDMMQDGSAGSSPRTLATIIQDVQSGKLSKDAGKAEALKLGLIANDVPQVPRPE